METKYGGRCFLKKIWGCWGITLCYFDCTTWLDTWRKGRMEEWPINVDIQHLQKDPSVSNTFVWNNDSLWYKDRLYICKESQMKQKVFLELHTSPIGGHSGS